MGTQIAGYLGVLVFVIGSGVLTSVGRRRRRRRALRQTGLPAWMTQPLEMTPREARTEPLHTGYHGRHRIVEQEPESTEFYWPRHVREVQGWWTWA